jgi:hypothetical protein
VEIGETGMDFNQLKEAYLKVLEEYRELKKEINKFKQQLKLMDPVAMIALPNRRTITRR